jgi:small subunit ribosomal protein S21
LIAAEPWFGTPICGFVAFLPQSLEITNDLCGNYPLLGVFWRLSRLGLFGGVFFLAEVRVQEGEPLENALRRFKRKVQTEDIIKEVKRHSFYLKPGEKKRVKEALARKRNRKKVRKEQD